MPRIFFQISSRVAPLTMLVAVMAPGLTIGFISAPLYCSTATIELKTWPVASTPMLLARASTPDSSITSAIVNTFEIDWIDTSDLMIARRVDLAVRGDERDAEDVGVHLRQRRDVVGVLAFLQVLVLLVGGVDGRLDVALRVDRRLEKAATATAAASATFRNLMRALISYLRMFPRSCI